MIELISILIKTESSSKLIGVNFFLVISNKNKSLNFVYKKKSLIIKIIMASSKSEINLEIIKHITDRDDMINFIHLNPEILQLKETKLWQNNSKVITHCAALLDKFIFMKPEFFDKICKKEKNCLLLIQQSPDIYKTLPTTSQTNIEIASFYLSKINEQDIFSGPKTINTMIENQYHKSDLHPEVFNDYNFCIKAFSISNLIIHEFPESNWNNKQFLVLFFTALDKLIIKNPSKTMHYVNLIPENIKVDLKNNSIEPGKFNEHFSKHITKITKSF